MGRIYSAAFAPTSVTGISDLLEISAPSDMVVTIRSIRIGQVTEFGDAAAEMLDISITRYTGADGAGSSITPQPHIVSDTAATATVRGPGTEGASKGTPFIREAWNIQAGWLYQPTPEELIYLSPSGKLAIALPIAPDDSTDFEGTITFEEIGG